MRHRLAIARVDHRRLVNPEYFAQQRGEAVEETLRHVSTRVSLHCNRYWK